MIELRRIEQVMIDTEEFCLQDGDLGIYHLPNTTEGVQKLQPLKIQDRHGGTKYLPWGTEVKMLGPRPCPTRADAHCGPNEGRAVRVRYRNHKGVVAIRTVVPQGIRWHSTQWHPTPQWLLEVWDCDKKAFRDFALRDVLEWAVPEELPGGLAGVVAGLVRIPGITEWARKLAQDVARVQDQVRDQDQEQTS